MKRWWAGCVLGLVACTTDPPALPFTGDAGSLDAGSLDAGSLDAGERADRDGDGVDDARDGCPDVPDPEQLDADYDGIGNACERPPEGACDANGVCWEWPDPGRIGDVSRAAAWGEELWLLAENNGLLWRLEGLRWEFISMPFRFTESFDVTAGSVWLKEEVDSGRAPTAPLWRWQRATRTWQSVVELPSGVAPTVIDDEHVWWSLGGDRVAFFDGRTITELTTEELIQSDYGGVPPSERWRLATPTRFFEGGRWVTEPDPPCGAGNSVFGFARTPDGPWAVCRVGPSGELRQRTPSGWVDRGAVPTQMHAWLWGTGADDLWISDPNFASLFRYSPHGWTHELVAPSGRFYPLPQASAARAWAVTFSGGVWRRDAGAWQAVSQTAPWISVVSGDRNGDTWVGGWNGFLAKRKDGRWAQIPSGRNTNVRALAARDGEVWMSAEQAGVQTRKGGQWRSLPMPGGGDVDTILAFDAATWFFQVGAMRLDRASGQWLTPPTQIYAVNSDSEDNLWGTHNDQLARWTGTAWEGDPSVPIRPNDADAAHGELWATWGSGPADSLVRRRTASGWTEQKLGPGAVARGVVIRAPGEAWVGDDSGRVWLADATGASIVREHCGLVRVGNEAGCLSHLGLAPLEAAAFPAERLVAAGGRLLRLNGFGWEPLGAAATDAWTDGTRALVLRDRVVSRYEAGQWTELAQLGDGVWRAVWSEGGLVFAAGETPGGAGLVVRVEGAQGRELPSPGGSVGDLAGDSGEIYAARLDGGIARWDGQQWGDASAPPLTHVRLASGGGALFAVGAAPGGLRVLRRVTGAWTEVATPAAWLALGTPWTDGESLWLAIQVSGVASAARWTAGTWTVAALPELSAYDIGGVGSAAARRVFVVGGSEAVRLP